MSLLQSPTDVQITIPPIFSMLPSPAVTLVHSSPGCIIVHKPPGVPFHATAEQPGLMQLVRSQQGQPHLPHDGPLWPVHRLDAMTSGCLVLATSRTAAGSLIRSFAERRVHKYYVALSAGSQGGSSWRPNRKQGSIVGDMCRSRGGCWMLSRSRLDPAVTRFTSAAVASQQRPGLRAFLLKPESGKTHQLRVAMKSLSAPVLGDVRYARKDVAAGEQRGYLHCAALRFELQGRYVQAICPPAHGEHFESVAFRALFDAWFPQRLAEDAGSIWFDDSRLLRSQLLCLEADAARAAATEG